MIKWAAVPVFSCVKAFSGADQSLLESFIAYDGYTGGVRVGTADLNHDGLADVLTGTRSGASPHLKAFDGRTAAELLSEYAYDPAFLGGIGVSCA